MPPSAFPWKIPRIDGACKNLRVEKKYAPTVWYLNLPLIFATL